MKAKEVWCRKFPFPIHPLRNDLKKISISTWQPYWKSIFSVVYSQKSWFRGVNLYYYYYFSYLSALEPRKITHALRTFCDYIILECSIITDKKIYERVSRLYLKKKIFKTDNWTLLNYLPFKVCWNSEQNNKRLQYIYIRSIPIHSCKHAYWALEIFEFCFSPLPSSEIKRAWKCTIQTIWYTRFLFFTCSQVDTKKMN